MCKLIILSHIHTRITYNPIWYICITSESSLMPLHHPWTRGSTCNLFIFFNFRFIEAYFTCSPVIYQAPLSILWDYPGKDTGVGCHFLLQGAFLTQRSNPHLLGLLNWQVDSLPAELSGKSSATEGHTFYKRTVI